MTDYEWILDNLKSKIDMLPIVKEDKEFLAHLRNQLAELDMAGVRWALSDFMLDVAKIEL